MVNENSHEGENQQIFEDANIDPIPRKCDSEVNETDDSEHSLSDNKLNNDHIAKTFEDYSYPSFIPFQGPNNTQSKNNDKFLWILIWIMNFRIRFNLPEMATESLIKFMKLVLEETGIDLPNGPSEHYLAYISWYHPADSTSISTGIPYSQLIHSSKVQNFKVAKY
ncbi:8225_t:CDS:2, partial [Funneliformis geosporum]